MDVSALLARLGAELEAWGEALDHPAVDTLYFGGGTPSLMPPETVAALIAAEFPGACRNRDVLFSSGILKKTGLRIGKKAAFLVILLMAVAGMVVAINIATRKPAEREEKARPSAAVQLLGLSVSELGDAQKKELKIKGGVKVDAATEGGARAGLREGDVITQGEGIALFQGLISNILGLDVLQVIAVHGRIGTLAIVIDLLDFEVLEQFRHAAQVVAVGMSDDDDVDILDLAFFELFDAFDASSFPPTT